MDTSSSRYPKSGPEPGQKNSSNRLAEDAPGAQVPAAEVERLLAQIRTAMPNTYAYVQARAAEQGHSAFAQVRRALRGVPDLFYAVEAGHVVGTPFKRDDLTDDMAALMLRFGLGHLVMWGEAPPSVDGTPAGQVGARAVNVRAVVA